MSVSKGEPLRFRGEGGAGGIVFEEGLLSCDVLQRDQLGAADLSVT